MPTKKLKPAKAFEAWGKLRKLVFKVDPKLIKDHFVTTTEAISKETCINHAVERFIANGNTKSSWMQLSSKQLKDKAKDRAAKKVARVHQKKQQLAVRVKVERRTVEIEEIDRKHVHQYKGKKRYGYREVEKNGNKVHLTCSSEINKVEINVVGPWKPVSGEVTLYHYEEKALPHKHELLDKYLEWNVNESGEPFRPVATK